MILITGGAGFIGSHLSKYFIGKGEKIRILDNLSAQIHGEIPSNLEWLSHINIEFIRGSVTSRSDLERAMDGIDKVIHLAAETGTGQSMYEIEKYNSVNVIGTALIMDFLANSKKGKISKFILASSRSIYGEGSYLCPNCSEENKLTPESRTLEQLQRFQWDFDCPICARKLKLVATSEDAKVQPASIYAATKLSQEDIVRITCSSLNISYDILRFQNVYGEGQSLSNPYTGILSIFSTKIRHDKELPIFEDGMESRDFVHVSDIVQAIHLALDSDISGIYNVGSGIATSIESVAEHLSIAYNKPTKTVITKQFRLGDIRHNYADLKKINNDLGYVPKIDLKKGLKLFADWVLSQELHQDIVDNANKELKDRNLMG